MFSNFKIFPLARKQTAKWPSPPQHSRRFWKGLEEQQNDEREETAIIRFEMLTSENKKD